MTMSYMRVRIYKNNKGGKPRAPKYSIAELARMLDVTYDTLLKRIKNAKEQPVPAEKNEFFRDNRYLYTKESFMQWHAKNFPNLHKMPEHF